jgi:hypothetical protein
MNACFYLLVKVWPQFIYRVTKSYAAASAAKLIHNWNPTNNFLHKQGQTDTHQCLKCKTHPETADRIIQCEDSEAHDRHQELLYNMLHKLVYLNTSMSTISILEQELTKLLNVASLQKDYNSTPS